MSPSILYTKLLQYSEDKYTYSKPGYNYILLVVNRREWILKDIK